MDRLPAITPGELLKEEFLVPLGISQYRLAKEIGVPAQRIGQIVLGNRRVTADTDLRLCKFFGLSDGYWLRAQEAYDLEVARRAIESDLLKITPWESVRSVDSRVKSKAAKGDAIYEVELNRALSEAESDFENGRYVVGFDEGWKRISELRKQREG